MLMLAVAPWVVNLSLMFFFLVCLLLILFIMIQKPQGGGLSAAFGASSGSGQTAFGTKTGDALTVGTIIMFIVWLLLAITANFLTRPDLNIADQGVQTPPASLPAETPAEQPTPEGSTPSATPGATPPATPIAPPATPPTADPTPIPAPSPTPEPINPPAPK